MFRLSLLCMSLINGIFRMRISFGMNEANNTYIINAASDEYQNGDIYCNEGHDCIVVCDEEYSCYKVLNCPLNAACHIKCIARYSCYNARINWSDNDVISNISCIGDHACYGVNFPVPPSNDDFKLICNNEHGCESSLIFCPQNANCDIICNDWYSCQYATIIWSTNKSINSSLTCYGTGFGTDACLKTTRPPIYAPDDNKDFFLECTEDIPCTGSIINCPKNGECYISCNGRYSCYGATFKWPENRPYNLSCYGYYACQKIVYTPYNDNNPFVMNCNGPWSTCSQSVLNCPDNANCNIICSGSYSCSQSIINCPINNIFECNILCQQQYACYRATINGYGNIICDGDSACRQTKFPIPPPNTDYLLICDECTDAVIICPSNADCHIICDQCENALIHWSTNNTLNSTLTCSDVVSWNACKNVNPPPFDIYYTKQNEYSLCDEEHECNGAIINCPSDGSCDIKCGFDYSCNGAIFKWDDNMPYDLMCADKEGSCRAITFNPYDNNEDFNLHCHAWKMCEHTTIHCPLNASCNITCSGDVCSCRNAVIYGPINNTLTVNCIGGSSCYDAVIYAQNSSLFILNGCSAPSSCTYLSIWFPMNDNGTSRAFVNGADNDGLVFGPFTELNFYAINGWDDVEIINYATKYIYHSGIMHCTDNYDVQCDFLQNKWSCNPYGDTTCDMKTTISTTTTSNPTTATSNPTTTISNSPSPNISDTFEGRLKCGQNVSGATTESNDVDYYLFTVNDTNSVLFDSCGSLYDTYLYFYESDWTLISKCDDCGSCGTRTQLAVSPVTTGTYILGISNSSFSPYYGRYNMSVQCTKITDLPTNHPITTYSTLQQTQTPTDDLVSTTEFPILTASTAESVIILSSNTLISHSKKDSLSLNTLLLCAILVIAVVICGIITIYICIKIKKTPHFSNKQMNGLIQLHISTKNLVGAHDESDIDKDEGKKHFNKYDEGQTEANETNSSTLIAEK